jgi:hypothetical protein
MPTLAIVLRIGKLLGVLAFFAGAVGATCSRDFEDRQRFAYRLAAPGFFLLWGFGVGLSQVSKISLLSAWLLVGAFCSLVIINAVLYAAGKPDRATRGARLFALAPFAVALVLMVWRP